MGSRYYRALVADDPKSGRQRVVALRDARPQLCCGSLTDRNPLRSRVEVVHRKPELRPDLKLNPL